MLRGALLTLAILVMLPSAASAEAFKYYGTHMGFAQDPDQMVFGGQLQWNGIAPRMAFVPGLDYEFNHFHRTMTLNGDFHYNLSYETAWQPYVGAGVGLNVWSDEVERRRNDSRRQPAGHMILGLATRNRSGGRFFTEMKLGFGDSPQVTMLAGWNLRSR